MNWSTISKSIVNWNLLLARDRYRLSIIDFIDWSGRENSLDPAEVISANVWFEVPNFAVSPLNKKV